MARTHGTGGEGYYENSHLGQRFVTEGRTVTEADVVNFAGLSGDFEPLHLDEAYAWKSSFGGRIAHGLCTLSIVSGLLERLGVFDGVESIFLGLSLRFTRPVYLGDSIHGEFQVTEKRESRSRPGLGIVTMEYHVHNQRHESMQEGQWVSMVPLGSISDSIRQDRSAQ